MHLTAAPDGAPRDPEAVLSAVAEGDRDLPVAIAEVHLTYDTETLDSGRQDGVDDRKFACSAIEVAGLSDRSADVGAEEVPKRRAGMLRVTFDPVVAVLDEMWIHPQRA